MQSVKPKWLESGLVLVCERCYKQRIPEETPELGEHIGDFDLRDWLKRELKTEGRWGPIRVVATSCMDVCAKGKVTVAIQAPGEAPDIVITDAINEKQELYDRIVERLGERTSPDSSSDKTS